METSATVNGNSNPKEKGGRARRQPRQPAAKRDDGAAASDDLPHGDEEWAASILAGACEISVSYGRLKLLVTNMLGEGWVAAWWESRIEDEEKAKDRAAAASAVQEFYADLFCHASFVASSITRGTFAHLARERKVDGGALAQLGAVWSELTKCCMKLGVEPRTIPAVAHSHGSADLFSLPREEEIEKIEALSLRLGALMKYCLGGGIGVSTNELGQEK